FGTKQLKSPRGRPVCVVQSVHCAARSAQSPPHSNMLPIMSNTPQLDLQLVRLPVLDSPPELVLQSFAPGVFPGSGVPAAASCHSRFVSSRFPERRHPCPSWHPLMQAP